MLQSALSGQLPESFADSGHLLSNMMEALHLNFRQRIPNFRLLSVETD
jgi:hypothetical protein